VAWPYVHFHHGARCAGLRGLPHRQQQQQLAQVVAQQQYFALQQQLAQQQAGAQQLAQQQAGAQQLAQQAGAQQAAQQHPGPYGLTTDALARVRVQLEEVRASGEGEGKDLAWWANKLGIDTAVMASLFVQRGRVGQLGQQLAHF
jgi:hypothetical protein